MNFLITLFQNIFQKLVGIFSDPPFEGSKLEKQLKQNEEALEELSTAVQKNRKILEKLKSFKFLILFPLFFSAKFQVPDAITVENCPQILKSVLEENTELLEKSQTIIHDTSTMLKSSRRVSYWLGVGFEKKYTKNYTDFSPEFSFQVQIPFIYPMIGFGISASDSDFGLNLLFGIH